ncbi:MAG: PHP domain-containing protein [Candidatus Cloacimonadaceae bacterium]|nr:PHP domain-containing protein [Candidatus Cloacimonadaceae bacterium]
MRWFNADLHIHSVLSPCGGLEMSPRELVARLKTIGIDWFAITDHNSMANCPAYEAVAKRAGIEFTWGMELQTSEEIHLLVYFDNVVLAQAFDQEVYASLLPLDNDADFFGDQVIIDENENILSVEQRALSNSSLWDLNTAVEMALAHDGFCVPAHVDSGVNSIISQLGFLPEKPRFNAFGITARADVSRFLQKQPVFSGKTLIRSSDAHYLSDLGSGFSRIRVLEAGASELAKAALRLDHRNIII